MVMIFLSEEALTDFASIVLSGIWKSQDLFLCHFSDLNLIRDVKNFKTLPKLKL